MCETRCQARDRYAPAIGILLPVGSISGAENEANGEGKQTMGHRVQVIAQQVHRNAIPLRLLDRCGILEKLYSLNNER